MKYLFLLTAFAFLSLLAWCWIKDVWSFPIKEENIYTWNNKVFSWNENNIIKWTISSWIIVSWLNGDITNSWNKIFYGTLFNISMPNKADKWEYYGNTLYIYNESDWWLSISTEKQNGVNTDCTYDYSEWVISKSIYTKKIWETDIYYADILFSISSPDTLPSKSWQSFLCFINNNVIYNISVIDSLEYRKDIINSFKFIK